MARRFLLYISAATDMEAERDILARSVIAIPVDLTWRIEQSPRGNAPIDQTLIATADMHLLLLGGDIRAPVGLEWIAARRVGRMPKPFLKIGASRTQAAEQFRRFIELQASWRPFASSTELQQAVQQLLARQIVDFAPTYGLSPDEIAQLYAWLTKTPEPLSDDQSTPGGAGDSSLVFSRERHEPSTGVLLEDADRRSSTH